MPRNGTTTQRGYDNTHKQMRAKLKPTVDAGEADCTEIVCLEERDGHTRWIEPGTSWALAHDRATGGYLGPAHARCNNSEGARYGNGQRTDQTRRDWIL
jgi:hypothetical protein